MCTARRYGLRAGNEYKIVAKHVSHYVQETLSTASTFAAKKYRTHFQSISASLTLPLFLCVYSMRHEHSSSTHCEGACNNPGASVHFS